MRHLACGWSAIPVFHSHCQHMLAESLTVPLTLFFSPCWAYSFSWSHFKEVVACREHQSLIQRLLQYQWQLQVGRQRGGFSSMTFKMADCSGYDIFLPFQCPLASLPWSSLTYWGLRGESWGCSLLWESQESSTEAELLSLSWEENEDREWSCSLQSSHHCCCSLTGK